MTATSPLVRMYLWSCSRCGHDETTVHAPSWGGHVNWPRVVCANCRKEVGVDE